ncbi:MAG: hypothetical protein V3V02_08145 [Rhizobiaceae bacterium]
MELLTHNPATTLALVSWIAICLVALITRANQVERETRSAAKIYYSQYEPK